MTFDWTISVGSLVVVIVQLVAMVGAYYGLKADIAALASNLALAVITEKTSRQSSVDGLKFDLMQLIAASEGAIKELSHRIGTLESGQDEWTKALRKRTHDLADQMNLLVLKVDRIERDNTDRRDQR